MHHTPSRPPRRSGTLGSEVEERRCWAEEEAATEEEADSAAEEAIVVVAANLADLEVDSVDSAQEVDSVAQEAVEEGDNNRIRRYIWAHRIPLGRTGLRSARTRVC